MIPPPPKRRWLAAQRGLAAAINGDVMLSEVKHLLVNQYEKQILRYAQDDTFFAAARLRCATVF